MSSFQVNQPNLENMQQYLSKEKERNSRSSSDGPKWWNIPAGMSSIRILPPWDPKGMVALPVFMHPIEYQEKDMKYKKYNWTCLQETFGKPCKICEGLQQMKAAGVDISKYEATRRQFYMNAIVMYDPAYQADISAGKKPEDASGVAPGTHVLVRIPKQIYDWVLSQITNPMVGDITSLTNGIDVYITKEGSGLGTKYTPTLSPNGRTPIPQEYLSTIESLHNLDEIFSTGFDDDLINRLVTHLKTSAGIIQQNIPGVVANMAGYQPTSPAPNPAIPNIPSYTPVNTTPTAPVGYGAPNTNGFSVAPSPFQQNPAQQVPVAPSMPTNPVVNNAPPVVPPTNSVVSAPAEENLPKCYGNYDASNVSCVVCPHEISC